MEPSWHITEALVTHSKIESAPSGPILACKLHSLTADERVEMEQVIMQHGEANALAHWDLIVAQIDYILSL